MESLNRPAALPPEADQPPLFKALLRGNAERAIALLQGGADARQTLLCGLTVLHAAALGGAAGGVPALVAAGIPVDAQLTAPVQLPGQSCSFLSSESPPAGSTALTLACAMSKAATVQALLAAGATYQIPALSRDTWMDLFAGAAISPWHWAAKRSRRTSTAEEAAAAQHSAACCCLPCKAMQRHGRPAGSCTYSKSCFTVQHGTCITLDAINEIIRQRMNAPLLEVLLGSGLPLPEVPRGSAQNPVAMWDGEFGNPQQFQNVCCPFYSLFRRDGYYNMKTPQELRVRMCQALLRAGYRPTVYNSIELQVLNKRGDCYVPRSLPNFHILRGWGRKGLSIDGTERICCFPGAYPEQDRLLTGDNRLLWMLVEGEPWSPADHRYWPPAFKAAARTLLLAHRRGAPVKRRSKRRSRASSDAAAAVELQATPLSHMPFGFVLAVIAAAAFPPDSWFDEASMQDWLALEFWREINFGF